jgi:hypothetical protein
LEKHSVSRLSYLFAHLYLLSSYSFSSDLLSSNLPLLSASSLLCFSSLHIVGSLTSKLPSIIHHPANIDVETPGFSRNPRKRIYKWLPFSMLRGSRLPSRQVAEMAPHLAEHLEVPPVLFKQVQRVDFWLIWGWKPTILLRYHGIYWGIS